MGTTVLAAGAVAGLLMVFPVPAIANGGAGSQGLTGLFGGAGGADSATGTGGAGAAGGGSFSGGGGGAGATGGAGGVGGGGTAGGAGGATPGATGQPGADNAGNDGGGGGGGGGAHGFVGAALPGVASAGGAGGAGGRSTAGGGALGGGGGGGGGFGAVITGSGALGAVGSAVSGGLGGSGGDSAATTTGLAGNGGGGGAGLVFTNPAGASLTIGAAVSGGDGGAGGTGTLPQRNGFGGVGGGGIQGQNLTITLAAGGSVAGGAGGDGNPSVIYSGAAGAAISFTGGTNVLELRAQSIVTGNVLAFSAGDTLRLGGTGNATFDLSQLGTAAKYRGFGVFEKTGTSTWTLTGNSASHSSGITLQEGTLRLASNLAASFGTITTTGSVIDYVDGVNSAAPININSNTTQLQVLTGTATQSGIISQTAGPRPLEKIGNGMLILTSSNTYSGVTTITGGTISVAAANNLGSDTASNRLILDGGTLRTTRNLDFNRPVTATVSGGTIDTWWGQLILSGGITFDGQLIKTGSGILRLVTANTGAGGIRLDQGFLVVGNNAAMGTGAITMATETLLFVGGFNLTFGNAVTVGGGAGSIIDPLGNTTFTGVIDGGQLTVTGGAGTVIFTNTNTYGATNVVAANTVQVGNGGTTGTLGTGDVSLTDLNARLAFNRSDAITIGNVISGTGQVRQIGTGTTTLTATNSYSGATTVSGGTLRVNGSIASSSGLTVASGATVGGTGTLPQTIVQGTIAPGNSVGTITVNGPLVLGGASITEIEFQGATADRINVNGAAILAGTLRLIGLGGPYSFGTAYTILNATGGRTGTFTTVENGLGGVSADVTYDPSNVYVTLSANALAPLLGPTGTPNQRTISGGIDRAVAGGGDPSFLMALYSQPTVQGVQAGLDQISGQVHANLGAAGFSVTGQFLGAMLDPLAAGRGPGGIADLGGIAVADAGEQMAHASLSDAVKAPALPAPGRFGVWASALGARASVAGDAGFGSFGRSDRFGGVAAGVDMVVAPGVVAGFALAGGEQTTVLRNGLGRMDADVFQAGLHARASVGAFTFGAATAFSWLDVDTTRNIPVLGLFNVRADHDARAWSGRFEAAWRAFEHAGFTVSPTAALQGASVTRGAFTERATLALAGLVVAGSTATTVRSELGGRIDARASWGSLPVTGFARAAWAHYLERDAISTASLAGLPGSTFTVTGARADRDAILASAGLDVAVTPMVTLGARVDGEWSETVSLVSGSARLGVRF